MLAMTRRVSETPQSGDNPAPDQFFAPGASFAINRPLPAVSIQRPQPTRGRRSQAVATQQGGHYVRATTPQGSIHDVALDATLRAAALRNARWGAEGRGSGGENSPQPPCSSAPLLITPSDLRVKVRRARTGNLILFVVDASGSMGARKRMVAVKGAILSLLLDAYQKRDRVGLITFRGPGARLLVPPTNSVELAERHLRQLPTGGQTPLVAGLQLAGQMLTTYLQRDAALAPLLVLVTDGRANSGSTAQLRQTAIALAQKRIAALVLDSEQGYVKMGQTRQVAGWLNAEYMLLDDLRAESISWQVRQSITP